MNWSSVVAALLFFCATSFSVFALIMWTNPLRPRRWGGDERRITGGSTDALKVGDRARPGVGALRGFR